MRGLCAILWMVLSSNAQSEAWAAQQTVQISNFAVGNLDAWQEKVFKGHTQYSLVDDEGTQVLRATSNASASGLFRELKIDLSKTPCLTWDWKNDHILKGVDETTKDGDDYAARVYVIFSGGMLFWKTKALNYVWSSNQASGTRWSNAFSANATMLAVQSGAENAGRWVSQQRNVRADYKRFIGGDITFVDAVAIMTDTDNSGQQASAYYRHLRFTDGC